jgi:hypothetical protein
LTVSAHIACQLVLLEPPMANVAASRIFQLAPFVLITLAFLAQKLNARLAV